MPQLRRPPDAHAGRPYTPAVLIHTLAHPGSDGPQPAVIALHGYGSHCMDLIGMAPMMAGGRLIIVCPQAPHRVDDEAVGYSWSQAPIDSEQSIEGMADAPQDVLAFLDEALQRYPIDPTRVALLGFSQGGLVAARAALAAPQRFVGLALLSSSLDEERTGVIEPAAGAADLPVLIQHGANDAVMPIVEAFSSLIRLQGWGLKPDLQQFPMQHEISHESAHSLSDWLEQVLGLEPSHKH